jgi:hypothetical protein
MTRGQARITDVYGWISVGILGALAVHYIISLYAGFKNTYKVSFFTLIFNHSINRVTVLSSKSNTLYSKLYFQPRGKDKEIPFTDNNIAAYIPQVKSPEIPYPLIACPVNLIQEDLFEWESPYHGYEYYDISLDAEAIMNGDKKGRSVSATAFSRVVHWANHVDEI